MYVLIGLNLGVGVLFFFGFFPWFKKTEWDFSRMSLPQKSFDLVNENDDLNGGRIIE